MKRLWNYLMNWYTGWQFERAVRKFELSAPPRYVLVVEGAPVDMEIVERIKDEFNRCIAESKAWSEPPRLTDSEERRLIQQELERQFWR